MEVDKYSFRQFLVAADTVDLQSSRFAQRVVSPAVLQAIGDCSQRSVEQSIGQRLINFYRGLNLVVRPGNRWLLCWQFLVMCVILFYLLEIGLLLGFGATFWNDELHHYVPFHVIFIFILVADILISPLKAFYDEGLLIKDVGIISRRYTTVDFWIDLVGVVVVVVPLATGDLEANWLKLFWLGKIHMMSKINVEFERVTQLQILLNTGYLVLKLIVFCYIYAHYMGIFFFMVSRWVYEHNYYGPNTPNLTWIYNSWAFYQMALILNWQQMYAYIMYYSIAVVTTIAYGDITPKNPIECIYTIFALIIVTLIFGYIMTEILRIMISVFSYNFDRRFNHFQLLSKLRRENVQQEIQAQIRAHTNEIDREEQFRNRVVEEKIMNFLPPQPLYGLLIVINQSFLKQLGLPFFHEFHLKMQPIHSKSLFLEAFMKEIKEERHYTGDLFYNEGDIDSKAQEGHSAYYFTKAAYSSAVILGVGKVPIIKSGKLDKIANQMRSSFEIRKAESIFGQMQFFNGQERSHWAFCVSNCVVLTVPRHALLKHYHLLTEEEKEVVFTNIEGAADSKCLACLERHNLFHCHYSFLNKSDMLRMDQQVSRKKRILKECRTRLKSQSPWTMFKSIREIRMAVTKEYRDRLLVNRANHSLFIQYELEEDTRRHEAPEYETELRETEYMVERLYEELLLEMGKTNETIEYDRVHDYHYYKPDNSINQIIKYLARSKRRQAFVNNRALHPR